MTAAVSFTEFFTAVHGHSPFPWQTALAERALVDGLPEIIDVPTGLGKTSLIDIGVWLAAVTGCEPGTPGRRRTFFVIDRRIVVDDAFAHAEHIAMALANSTDGACREIADALRALAGDNLDGSPLVVTRMRGGITWDWRWLDRPDRAAVVIGTVDQIGSRILFRGYGTGQSLAPIDAALAGTDSLIVVDEAHLALPFIATVDRVMQLDRDSVAASASSHPLHINRPTVVTMSATVPDTATRRHFEISDADRSDPVAARRLHAEKHLHLVEVGGPVKNRPAKAADTMAQLAQHLLAAGGVEAVGVVCNTVGRARAVFDRLRATVQTEDTEVLLLTGRIRPWDRERVQAEVLDVVGANRDRTAGRSAIVVATQTVEVGANLDFDALVTESASWDALVQRLGRLNRMGLRTKDAFGPTHALVVHDQIEEFVYGPARMRTWEALTQRAPVAVLSKKALTLGDGLDVSPDAVRKFLDAGSSTDAGGTDIATIDQLVAPATEFPLVTPSVLTSWTHTSPRPATDPPTAPFLHGYGIEHADVRVVWRSDLTPANTDYWPDVVAAVPPTAEEELVVPLAAFMGWVNQNATVAGDVADVPGGTFAEADREVSTLPPLQAIRLRPESSDPSDAAIITLRGATTFGDRPGRADAVSPGDLIVLPSGVGGCDRFGWAPSSMEPVPDIADLAGSAPLLRLTPHDTLAQTIGLADPSGRSGISEGDPDALRTFATTLEGELEDGVIDLDTIDDAFASLWSALTDKARATLAHDPDGPERATSQWAVAVSDGPGGHRVLARPRMLSKGAVRRFLADTSNEPGGSSITRSAVTLEDHQNAVSERARGMAHKLGLPPILVESVVTAAAWHDVGKLDPRFQVMLHGGDELAAEVSLVRGNALAKSGMDPAQRTTATQAFKASKLPRGFRHEVGSAQAVKQYVTGFAEVDDELVVHLVGAHHGRGRPFYPPVCDQGSTTLAWQGIEVELDRGNTVDLDGAARFERLNARYGVWGLALLESIVRLADIGCSEEGS